MADKIFPISSDNSDESGRENISKREIVYYQELGFEQAGLNRGELTSFRIHLAKIYSGYIEKNENLEHNTEKENKKIKIQIAENEAEINKLQNKIDDIENTKIPNVKDEIDELKDEIKDINEDPEKSIHTEKPDKFGLFMGIGILSFLTIYLWIFYSSATYSAFFRQISFNQNVILNSVFYPRAIAEALSSGVTALILTLVAPFIFIALGYLIHKFAEIKKFSSYIKISALIVITALFDAILAYEITKKIYDFTRENSFEEMDPYSISLAFQDVNFWLIIFAGFVVYIIWGVVLSFISESLKGFDKVKAATKKRKKKIDDLREKIKDWKDDITKFKEEIMDCKGEIQTLEKHLDAKYFNRKKFEKIIGEYTAGWAQYCVNRKNENTTVLEVEKYSESYVKRITDDLEKNQLRD